MTHHATHDSRNYSHRDLASAQHFANRRSCPPLQRHFGDTTNGDVTLAFSGTSVTALRTLAPELDQFDEDDNFVATTLMDEYYTTLAET